MLEKFLSICHFPTVISSHVIFREYLSGIFINCITDLGATMVLLKIGKIRKAARELVLDEVTIALKGEVIWKVSLKKPDPQDPAIQKQIRELKAKMNPANFDPANFLDIDIDALDLSRPDSIMTELQNLKYPAYITLLGIEESPFSNKAEILQMSEAPPSKFLTYSQELIYPEELETRNRFLHQDRQLKDYSFKGMRWYKDGEDWRKKEVSFIVDFALCEFWGRPARIGITKHEEDLRKFVD